MSPRANSLAAALFERGGLHAIFEHARNAIVATLLIAAGLEASKRTDDLGLVGVISPMIAGYFVAGIGCVLIVLNFIDGFRKLAKLQWNILLQVALSLAYLFASVRIVQLIVLWRTHA